MTFIILLSLTGCAKKEAISDSSLKSFTMTRTVNGADSYQVLKDGNKYLVTLSSGIVNYYIDFGSKTYLYTNEEKTTTSSTTTTTTNSTTGTGTTTSEDDTTKETTIKYVKSEKSDVELSDYADVLSKLTMGSLSKNSDGSYSFKDLVNNETLLPFMKGIYLDSITELQSAYSHELVELTSATLKISNKKPQSLSMVLSYASKSFTIDFVFSRIGQTTVEILEESSIDKDYYSSLHDGSPIVTLNYKGYGKIKVQLFTSIKNDVNTANYFIYLVKNSYYNKAVVDEAPSVSVFFGKSTKTIKNTVASDADPYVSNTRGTLSMVLSTTSSSTTTYTSQLILNLQDNTATYDAKSYTPIGGIISGFSVLDSISNLTSDEISKVSVSISIDYNGYVFVAPDFDN